MERIVELAGCGHGLKTPVTHVGLTGNDRLHRPPYSLALCSRLQVGRENKKPLAGARGLRAGRGRRWPPVPGRTRRSLRTGAPAANNRGEREHGGSVAQFRPFQAPCLRMRAAG
ncbi:hypothetical protein STXM2123_5583 [Streptomyces sp. F-3]|nr:hypothetical protein STXM2123_5583 [Streptomyces sp. F-3]